PRCETSSTEFHERQDMKKAASMGAKREFCAMGTLMGPEAHLAWMRHWRRMKIEEFAAAHQFGRHWKSTGHVAIGEATRVMRGPVFILNGRRQDAPTLLAIRGRCED